MAGSDGWNKLVRVTTAVEKAAPMAPVISLVALARWLGRPDAMPSQREIGDLPDFLRGVLYNKDRGIARVLVLAPEPMRSEETLSQHDRLTAAALASDATAVTGLPVILRHESIAIIKQLSSGLVLACFICVLLIAAFFRWLGLLWVLIIPNLLPLLLVVSSVHILNNGQIDPVVVLALTIAFGIAVDNSIHLVNMYAWLKSRGLAGADALRQSMERTGQVMIVTTVIMVGSFLASQVSDFSTVRLFGQLLILALVTALACDLLLLPALLRLRWIRR